MKKIICRIHRYEVFTDYIYNVNWGNVDSLIVVTEHLKRIIKDKISDIEYKVNIQVIENGVNINNFKLKEREKGFNIAYVGYIHQRKNPTLLLQVINKLVSLDKRYKLYIAGEFQDELVRLYWNYQVEKMNLKDNIIFNGWQKDINKWLEDKNYILSTSIHESFGYGIAEAMCLGVKPIIHDFIFSEEVWGNRYTWRTIDEAIKMIINEDYNSNQYREFIVNNYSLDKQITRIINIVNKLIKENKYIKNAVNIINEVYLNKFKCDDTEEIEDLTFIIPTYNRAELLYNDLKNQLKFSNVSKFIVDDYSDKVNRVILNKLIEENFKYNVENIVLNKKNKGLSYTRNLAIDSINSKFIGFIDDDDCLISLDNKFEFKNVITNLYEDLVIIIPRYVFNLYENGKIDIGQDRGCFNNKLASDMLKIFVLTGEIMVFNNGAVYNIKLIKNNKPNDFFRFAEDFLMLARILGNNLNKKIKVIESSFLIRRRSPKSLVSSLNEEKVFMHLIAMVVGANYCLKNQIICKNEFLQAFKNRYILLQNIHGLGEKSGLIIENYIKCIISIEEFKKEIDSIVDNVDYNDLPTEFWEIIKYF